jgi:carboxymethylenebutenolidase
VQITISNVELTIDGFPCRTYVAAPKTAQTGGRYPGIILYSEIFQLTGPICRTVNRLAGHGFVVAAPEIYHRTCPPGLVIAYDDPGRMHGNHLAHTTPVAHFDSTATAVFDHFNTRNDVMRDSAGPLIGAMGFCMEPGSVGSLGPTWLRTRLWSGGLLAQAHPVDGFEHIGSE